MAKHRAKDEAVSITIGDTGVDSTLQGAFGLIIQNYNTDTVLDALSKALSRQARRQKDAGYRRYDLAEAKAIMELSDRITAGEIY